MTTFNPRLHGMRALAAIGVLLFHWAQLYPVQTTLHPGSNDFGFRWHLSFFIGFGWMGVTLFFVLSGYLLTSILKSRPVTGRATLYFWRRRILRIYPAVWLQVAIFAALGASIDGLPSMQWDTKSISNAFLFINLPPLMVSPINLVWWTLPIELSFYLLLPVLVLASRRLPWPIITLACIAITVCWRWATIAVINDPPFYKHLNVLDSFPGILTPFILGFAIAHLPTPRLRWHYAALTASLIAAYLLLLAINFNLSSYWQGGLMLILWPSLLAVTIAGAVWACSAALPGFTWLGSKPLVWLGNLSFGIYLWHYPCFTVVKTSWPHLANNFSGSIISLIITCVVTLILAAFSYYFIEKPVMGWRHPKAISKTSVGSTKHN
ncbi:acyltransferase family protein [Gilvimarinus chinensis]|uniref:acyltransferase family protein n=1 Tax=Gilvimarinus chinensis TaxID=396005 RepID=UPI0003A7ACC7|nr:acyltransferase [Gilvimarinus chinensis]